jgi:hypothetical protein
MAIGSSIPAKIIEKVVPLVLKNMDKLQAMGSLLSAKCNNLPLQVKCSDPRINDIKKLLDKLKKFIASIKKLIATIKKIIKALKKIVKVATVIKVVQMILPLPPFFPPGPIAELLGIVNKLLQNLKSAMPSFLAMLDIIKLTVSDMNNVMAMTLMLLGSVCSNESFEASEDVNKLLADRSTNTSTSATSVNNNGDNLILDPNNNTYDALMSSDEDLNEYIDLLNGIANDLNTQAAAANLPISNTNITSVAALNVEEAPTLVYSGNGVPDVAMGKSGDYYVDLNNATIYGPKSTDVSWV